MCPIVLFFKVYIGDTVLCDTDWQLAVNILGWERERNVVAQKTDCQFDGDAMGLSTSQSRTVNKQRK